MSDLNHQLFLQEDFAILNPLQLDPSWWRDLDSMALTPKLFDGQSHLMPRLIELRILPMDVKVRLLERSDDWAKERDFPLFSALLRSTAPRERVASRLIKHMVLRGPDGGEAWLRYHDPRVFMHLHRVLGSGQMRSLMGTVTEWTYLNPIAGSWLTFDRPDVIESALSVTTPAQWGALTRMEQLNRCLRSVADLARLNMDQVSAFLDERIREAIETERLEDPEDIRRYAENALRYGQHLHRNPQMKSLLDAVRRGEMSYITGCSDIGEEGLGKLTQVNAA